MSPHSGRNFSSLSLKTITAVIVIVTLSQAASIQAFSVRDQMKLLKFVNSFRSEVACRDYNAANMQEIFWDRTLADWGNRDSNACAVIQLPKSGVTGVAILLQNYTRIEDLIGYLRRDPVSRPYLAKASFTSMGCGLNMTNCNKRNEIVCYWYPQCGSLFNAFEEGPLACREFDSEVSKRYKNLCVRNQALPSPSETQAILSEICTHKDRRKLEKNVSQKVIEKEKDSLDDLTITSPSKKNKKSTGKESEPTTVMKFLFW